MPGCQWLDMILLMDDLDLEREQAERRDAEAAASEMKRQLAQLKEKIVSLDVEIEQYRAEVDSHRKGIPLYQVFVTQPLNGNSDLQTRTKT